MHLLKVSDCHLIMKDKDKGKIRIQQLSQGNVQSLILVFSFKVKVYILSNFTVLRLVLFLHLH